MENLFEKYGIHRAIVPSAQTAYEYLMRNELLHMDMLEALRRNSAELMYAADDGVLMLNKKSDTYLVSAEDEASAQSIMSFAEDDSKLIAARGKGFDDYSEDALVLRQFVYNKKQPPQKYSDDIRDLDVYYAAQIADKLDMDYIEIRDMLESGLGCGAFVNDELQCFLLLNNDLSLNPAKAILSFEGEEALYAYAIDALLRLAYTPYGQVRADGEACERIQKCGLFEAAGESIYMF